MNSYKSHIKAETIYNQSFELVYKGWVFDIWMLFDLSKAEIILQILRIDLNLSTKHFMRREPTTISTSQEIKIISWSPKDISWMIIRLFGRRVIFEVIESIATIQNNHRWTSGTLSDLRTSNLRRRQRIITHHQMILFLLLELHISWDVIPIVPHILGFFILVWELLLHINEDTWFLAAIILLSQLRQGTVSAIISLAV
jgi:hypothetical protein